MTRVGSAARNPTGKTVPRTIGTSPKMSPGCRSPTTRSIPSTDLTGSIRPSSTAKSARSSPSFAANSPGARVMSAATRASLSRASASRAENTGTAAMSSAVTTIGGSAGPPVDGHHRGAAEADVVLEGDVDIVDLARVGVAAQLPVELGALGQSGGAEGMALRDQSARRVDDGALAA